MVENAPTITTCGTSSTLKALKWDHLTKIAYEYRIRDQKLRLEISQAKKENEVHLECVEQSKQFEKMEERKSDKNRNGDAKHDAMQEVRRTFLEKAPTCSKLKQSLGDGALEEVFDASRRNKRRRVA